MTYKLCHSNHLFEDCCGVHLIDHNDKHSQSCYIRICLQKYFCLIWDACCTPFIVYCHSYHIVLCMYVSYCTLYAVLMSTCCRYHEACIAISNREEKVAAIAEQIETNLTLVGATAIEDKLQQVIVIPQANAAYRLIVRHLLSRPYLYYEHLTYKVTQAWPD